MEPKPKNLEPSEIRTPVGKKLKARVAWATLATVALIPEVIPTKQDFLDLADWLEENTFPDLDQDDIAILARMFRGEQSVNA